MNDALWMLGTVGVVLALVAGVFLVVAPQRALALGTQLNREFSFGWLARALDAPRRADPFFYRHHRLIGILLLLATGYFFWVFATAWETGALAAMFRGTLPAVVLSIIAQSFTMILVLGNALGFALGWVLLLRPSALKGTEAVANRWVDTEQAAQILNRSDDRPETLAHRFPRQVGVVILLATAYIAFIGLVLLN